METFDNSLVESIELRMIRPSKFPVRYADQKHSPELANLKTSIRTHGLLQPIVVRPLEHGFEIVAGHRRHAACKSLRWRFIPCKIREFSDQQAFEIQLTENLQRKSMDPIEEAEAYQKYVVDFGWGGVSDLGRKIGKSEEYVSHRMQLLKLPSDVREKITGNSLSISQALELTTVGSHLASPTVGSMADDIVDNKMTVRQIRKMKSQLVSQTEDYEYRAEPRSKEDQIIRKTMLALKITLSRLDDMIDDAHKAGPKERAELVQFLMTIRRRTHSMIDEAIKYKKELKR
jgi:ParB family chromosome partitioning protein